MTLSTILVILVLGATAVFAYQNEPLLRQVHTIMLPGGAQSVPLVGVLLATMVAAVVLLWLLDAANLAVAAAGRRRAERRLAERERELTAERARLQEETSRRLDDLSRKIDERWARPAAPATTVEVERPAAPVEPETQEQTTVWRRTGS